MVKASKPEARPAPVRPEDTKEWLRLRSVEARLRGALARCRSALTAAADASGGTGGGRTPADRAEAEATIRALRATLRLVAERLAEAERAQAETAERAAALAQALGRERAAARREAMLQREAD